MDLPINKIHRILLDAVLPSSIEDLKNPTEDYIVNLLTTFLSRFYIDKSVIDQPIGEQYAVMTYYEDSDIINLINLHAALTQIFNKIFLSDFCITDITSPGQKRLRRQAKYLANFILYAMQKRLEFNDRIDKIQARPKLLEELKDKKSQVMEAINSEALHKAKQLSLIKKIETDIQHMHLKLEKINNRDLELEVMKNDSEKENQKAKEICGSVKTEAGELFKRIAKLQSEVVQSPQEYQSRLDEFEKQNNLKIEERNIMEEAIQDKKQFIKQIEMKLNFVQRNELATSKDIYKQLRNQKVYLDNIQEQIDSVNNIRNEKQNKLAMHKNQMNTVMDELKSYREEDIASLRNLYNQLLSERRLKKAELETSKACFNEKCLGRNKLQEDIKKKEEETIAFSHSCQEMYDNEIASEFELRKIWKDG